ncbi:MAG TPA: hypothetical protein VIM20_02560 [Candidatus Limnocylindrales bacterium]
MDEKRDASAGDPAIEGKTAGGEPADESFAWTGSAGGPDSTASGGDARATADASGKLAERSRTWAAELRNKIDDAGNGSGDQSGGATTAVLEGADDPVELAAKDDPAEGSRE